MTKLFAVAVWLIFCGLSFPVQAGNARIIKVLPHFLDAEGRHALSPSLFDRDAYQDYLRKNPAARTAVRFDINWKARGIDVTRSRVRLELRTNKNRLGKPLVLETPIKRKGWLGNWSRLTWKGDEFKNGGEILAWRATLWEGDQQIAEQTSFLW